MSILVTGFAPFGGSSSNADVYKRQVLRRGRAVRDDVYTGARQSVAGGLYGGDVYKRQGLPVVSLFPHSASFRFSLTTDTLAFGFLLPATGRIRVFHPLDTCAAGRSQKDCPLRADCLPSIRHQFPISNGTPPSESSHTSDVYKRQG